MSRITRGRTAGAGPMTAVGWIWVDETVGSSGGMTATFERTAAFFHPAHSHFGSHVDYGITMATL